MKNNLITIIIALSTMIYACSDARKELLTKINGSEAELKQNLKGKPDVAKVKKMISLYEEYFNKYGNDSTALRYMFEAANLYMGMGNMPKAIACCDTIIAHGQGSSEMPNAIFFKAFIYDESLRDTTAAKAYYKQLFTEFPQHELADDAKLLYERCGQNSQWIEQMIAKGDTAVPVEMVK